MDNLVSVLFQSKSILVKGKIKFHNFIFRLFHLNPVECSLYI